ncbi:FAD-binding domain-containing protein [Serendipita vermifera]|nr:FAD-binding domain-containing protein [Serendipita vermifera]
MIRALNFDWKTPLLEAGFTGDLVTPSDPDYQVSLKRFVKNAQRNAALVAFVRCAEDVSRVINFASNNSIPFVVKGGGHSASGASSIEDGIVIDLSRYLTTVRVDEKNRLGYVGGGAVWKHVDEEAIKYGLAAVAGTVNDTGVGGLTLGGGYGWLMGEHGLVIDNLVQVTIVTADGTIRTANLEIGSDLFWAIRGAGPNFGCVTEFVYRLHPQRPTVYAGRLIFAHTKVEAVVTALEEWYNGMSEKEGALMGMVSEGPTGQPAVVVLMFFNGDEQEGKKRFHRIFDVGPIVNEVGVMPYEQVNTIQNESMPYGVMNCLFSGLVRGNLPPTTASAIFQKQIELAKMSSSPKSTNPATNEGETSSQMTFTTVWQYWSLKKASEPAPDSTAYRMRVPYPMAALGVFWVEDDEELCVEAKKGLKTLKAFCEDKLRSTFGPSGPSADGTGYGNGESHDSKAVSGAEALFGGNYKRLQTIKSKYDPNMLFNSWYPIQPASNA